LPNPASRWPGGKVITVRVTGRGAGEALEFQVTMLATPANSSDAPRPRTIARRQTGAEIPAAPASDGSGASERASSMEMRASPMVAVAASRPSASRAAIKPTREPVSPLEVITNLAGSESRPPAVRHPIILSFRARLCVRTKINRLRNRRPAEAPHGHAAEDRRLGHQESKSLQQPDNHLTSA
jgi:hypothetical protein